MELHTQLLVCFPNNKNRSYFHHGLTHIKYANAETPRVQNHRKNRRTEKDPKSSKRVTLLHTGCRLNRRHETGLLHRLSKLH